MFLGTYEPKLDDKGRLILPAKFREQLAAGVILTPGQDRCVYAFTTADFQSMYEEFRLSPPTSKQARDYVRVLASGASDQIPDRQGRISVPANLREYANLDRDLVVTGSMSRVEIWDKATWTKYFAKAKEGFAEAAEEILPGLF